jgi:5-methylcytosine-specific restriction endonuclease McrA
MPTVPRSYKCAQLGCKEPKSKLNPYCTMHGGVEYTQAKETDSRYQSHQWRTTRTAQLTRQPLCQSCLTRGRIEQAKHVDHLFPWRAVGEHAFTRNVMQSLCPACHSHKTGKEKQGIILHHTIEGTVTYTLADYGQVMHKYLGGA